MFKLLRYFSIISLIAFVAVIAVLGQLYRSTALRDLMAVEESKNVALTQSFANSLWVEFAPFVDSASEMGEQELRDHPETARLRAAVIMQMDGLSVVKVKVYDLEGLTVFSTEASQIGEDKSSNSGFLAARSGVVASDLTHRDTFSAFEGTIADLDVVSSYIPIWSQGSTGRVEGVFELYSDVTGFLQRIEGTQRALTLDVTLILAGLYAILFFVVRHADGIIRRQHVEREQARQALQGAHDLLEERVALRTADLNAANEQLRAEIAQREKIEAQQALRLMRLAALREIDRAITASMDLGFTLKILLEKVTTALGVHAADVLLLNPHTLTLRRAASRGFGSGNQGKIHFQLSEGTAGRAVLERRAVIIPNLAEDGPSSSALYPAEGFRAYCVVPLVAKGQVKGALEVFHREPLDPDAEWLDFLETLAGQAAIAVDNAQLFENLERSNSELMLAYDTTLEGWSSALDLRDKDTEGHTQRVAAMTMRLARVLGVGDDKLVHIRRGALLHDIGKMGIPDSILLKPGPLTEEEWDIMRRHPLFAYEMLAPIDYLHEALDIPYCHHEKWDGSGYPRSLQGEQIPLAARIFAVVDVWDALRSDRPYRAAWPAEKALAHIREQSGRHFDPRVVEAFLGLEEIQAIEGGLSRAEGVKERLTAER